MMIHTHHAKHKLDVATCCVIAGCVIAVALGDFDGGTLQTATVWVKHALPQQHQNQSLLTLTKGHSDWPWAVKQSFYEHTYFKRIELRSLFPQSRET